MTTSFERLRPRAGGERAGSTLQDTEGKRALFSSSSGEQPPTPAIGAVTVGCGRCGEDTVLSPRTAIAALFPSLITSVRFGYGDRETRVGFGRRGVLLRCPACNRASWSQVTVRL